MVLEAVRILPIIFIQLRSATPSMSAFIKPMNLTIPALHNALSFEITGKE